MGKYKIYVDGVERPWDNDYITYVEVIKLSGKPIDPDKPTYKDLVNYATEEDPDNRITMHRGDKVEVKDGMRFYVDPSGRS